MLKKSDLLGWLDKVLDFIWPRLCLGCGHEGADLCRSCETNLLAQAGFDQNWQDFTPSFKKCRVCLSYQLPLTKKMIKHFKYSYIENTGKTLGQFLFKEYKKMPWPRTAVLVNIPLHRKKLLRRGFDQTEILAKELSSLAQLAYCPLLVRQKNTKTQARLNKQERQENLTHAFAINAAIMKKFADARPAVILIDDVATTGATLESASQVLMGAGFPEIFCLVLAKN